MPRSYSTPTVHSELKRWFLNHEECSLHQRIEIRGMMYEGHLRILAVASETEETHRRVRSSNERGQFVHFIRNLRRNNPHLTIGENRSLQEIRDRF